MLVFYYFFIIIKLDNLINLIKLIMIYTLKSFNTGQITLPKKRRDKFKTSIFIAEEQNGGLFIKPIVEDNKQVVYYENKEWFGIFSPEWLDPEKIISQIKQIQHG